MLFYKKNLFFVFILTMVCGEGAFAAKPNPTATEPVVASAAAQAMPKQDNDKTDEKALVKVQNQKEALALFDGITADQAFLLVRLMAIHEQAIESYFAQAVFANTHDRFIIEFDQNLDELLTRELAIFNQLKPATKKAWNNLEHYLSERENSGFSFHNFKIFHSIRREMQKTQKEVLFPLWREMKKIPHYVNQYVSQLNLPQDKYADYATSYDKWAENLQLEAYDPQANAIFIRSKRLNSYIRDYFISCEVALASRIECFRIDFPELKSSGTEKGREILTSLFDLQQHILNGIREFNRQFIRASATMPELCNSFVLTYEKMDIFKQMYAQLYRQLHVLASKDIAAHNNKPDVDWIPKELFVLHQVLNSSDLKNIDYVKSLFNENIHLMKENHLLLQLKDEPNKGKVQLKVRGISRQEKIIKGISHKLSQGLACLAMNPESKETLWNRIYIGRLWNRMVKHLWGAHQSLPWLRAVFAYYVTACSKRYEQLTKPLLNTLMSASPTKKKKKKKKQKDTPAATVAPFAETQVAATATAAAAAATSVPAVVANVNIKNSFDALPNEDDKRQLQLPQVSMATGSKPRWRQIQDLWNSGVFFVYDREKKINNNAHVAIRQSWGAEPDEGCLAILNAGNKGAHAADIEKLPTTQLKDSCVVNDKFHRISPHVKKYLKSGTLIENRTAAEVVISNYDATSRFAQPFRLGTGYKALMLRLTLASDKNTDPDKLLAAGMIHTRLTRAGVWQGAYVFLFDSKGTNTHSFFHKFA